MNSFQDNLLALYNEYVKTYADSNGVLPVMMGLKLIHTQEVTKNAIAIVKEEGFDDRSANLAVCAAILHDTGRYEQLRRFNTFRDADSVDHAEFSYNIVKEKGWLNSLPEEDANKVLIAVKEHNKRCISSGHDDITAKICNVVRDADKLDIFRILEHQVVNTNWKTENTAFWNLDYTKPPSAEVIASICRGETINYRLIKSLSDFVLIQVGWMANDLVYKTTRKLALERKHLEFRRDFLFQLSPGNSEIDKVCEFANDKLLR